MAQNLDSARRRAFQKTGSGPHRHYETSRLLVAAGLIVLYPIGSLCLAADFWVGTLNSCGRILFISFYDSFVLTFRFRVYSLSSFTSNAETLQCFHSRLPFILTSACSSSLISLLF
jgi:hypothetical protein